MKKYSLAIALVLVCITLFVGCSQNEKKNNKKVDWSKDSFTDISWTRDEGWDIETIYFGSDGHFSYYCGCGDPVNDSDLCEGYTYDDATQTITLDCIGKTKQMVTVIEIVKCDEKELHLDFDGDIRVFTK